MSEEPKILSLATVCRRTSLAVLAPQRAFRQIRDNEYVPAPQCLLTIFILAILDVIFHPYLLFRQLIFQMLPNDWLLYAIGWACFTVNQWLLCVLALGFVNCLMRGAVTTIGPIEAASCYLVGGLWLISVPTDSFHLLFGIHPIRIHVPWLAGREGHIVWIWARLSWLVMFPWMSISLGLVFRHVLHLRGRRQLALAALLAVSLPLAGRIIIEPLPNVVMHLLSRYLDWRPLGGWVVLGTQACLTLTTVLVLRRLLRHGPVLRDHPVSRAVSVAARGSRRRHWRPWQGNLPA